MVFLKISKHFQKKTCAKVYFLIKLTSRRSEAYNFIKKETLAQVFLCKFCKVFKNTFMTKYLRTNVCCHHMCLYKGSSQCADELASVNATYFTLFFIITKLSFFISNRLVSSNPSHDKLQSICDIYDTSYNVF